MFRALCLLPGGLSSGGGLLLCPLLALLALLGLRGPEVGALWFRLALGGRDQVDGADQPSRKRWRPRRRQRSGDEPVRGALRENRLPQLCEQ